jgi:hypothetical protein
MNLARSRGAMLAILWWSALLITPLFVFAQVKPSDAEREKTPWALRFDGIGPVHIGMSIAQLNAVLGEKFSMPKDKDEHECFYDASERHPNVAFMIIRGRVARIDVHGKGVRTSAGIQVGDSEAGALKAYGRAMKVEPHAYIPDEGHYLTVRSKDGRYGIRFETDKGKINMFYAGRADAIQYIEGCE